jgi:hypothetical protein
MRAVTPLAAYPLANESLSLLTVRQSNPSDMQGGGLSVYKYNGSPSSLIISPLFYLSENLSNSSPTNTHHIPNLYAICTFFPFPFSDNNHAYFSTTLCGTDHGCNCRARITRAKSKRSKIKAYRSQLYFVTR